MNNPNEPAAIHLTQLALAWDEGAEAMTLWMKSNTIPTGWSDVKPVNPYREEKVEI